MNINNFSILGSKNGEKRPKIFVYLYKFMDYNEVWFSRATIMKNPRKNLPGVLFS